jgi:hypothetical protein
MQNPLFILLIAIAWKKRHVAAGLTARLRAKSVTFSENIVRKRNGNPALVNDTLVDRQC